MRPGADIPRRAAIELRTHIPKGRTMTTRHASWALIPALLGLSLAWLANADTPTAGTKAAEKSTAGDKAASSDAEMIKSAMRAAPAAVSRHATIVAMEADGKMRTLRKGTNGFTCMPDNPATPGPDPMCMDANAMEWVHAWAGHSTPPAGKVGFMYMLEGGTDASNTDPYAAKPSAENHWIKTGSHVMIVGAASSFLDQYPKSADPDTSMPYVMW